MWIVAGGEVKARRYMHGNGVLWGLYIECVLGNDRDMIGGAHTLWFNVYGFLKFYEGGIAILGQSFAVEPAWVAEPYGHIDIRTGFRRPMDHGRNTCTPNNE